MARKAPDPEPRLVMLRVARKKIGRRTELVNADEMAAIAGMTWRHLKPQVEADPLWPVERRGSEGVSWQFNAAKVLDHMIAGLVEQQRDRMRRAERMARMAGIPVEMAQSGISVAELVKIDQLQTNAQRRKIEQGEWVRRSDHEAVIGMLLTTMQSETLATVSRLDPAGRWPATIRAEVADAMRTLLVTLYDQVGEKLKADAGPASEPRRRTGTDRR